VAKCVGRACNRACWTVYDELSPRGFSLHNSHGLLRSNLTCTKKMSNPFCGAGNAISHSISVSRYFYKILLWHAESGLTVALFRVHAEETWILLSVAKSWSYQSISILYFLRGTEGAMRQ
jgi:hypothetical protein